MLNRPFLSKVVTNFAVMTFAAVGGFSAYLELLDEQIGAPIQRAIYEAQYGVPMHDQYFYSNKFDLSFVEPTVDLSTTCMAIVLISSTVLSIYLIGAKKSWKSALLWLLSLALLSYTRDTVSYCLLSCHSACAWMVLLNPARSSSEER